jgi:sulfatase maturation enzyme AslB (radical SAM superfamily)
VSKFATLDTYTSTAGQYELLPFRFENLDDKNIVMTNFSGEFVLLERDKLDDIVHKKIVPNSDLYSLLRSRHFIKESSDSVSIELLALKTRTKFSNLKNFTNLHMFVVSLRCDHSCQYCQVSRQSDNKVAFDMTEATADKALDIVFRSPNGAIKIEFQGGEPLLNFDLIKYIVRKAKDINLEKKRDLQFVITTTLVERQVRLRRSLCTHDYFPCKSYASP